MEHTPVSEVSSTTSEDEFWTKLEDVRTIQSPKLQGKENSGARVSLGGDKQAGDSQAIAAPVRMERTISMLRAAKRVEIQNAVKLARSKVEVQLASATTQLRSLR